MFDKVQILEKQGSSDESNISDDEKPKSKKPAQKPSKTRAGDASRAPKKKNEPNRVSKEENESKRSAPSK